MRQALVNFGWLDGLASTVPETSTSTHLILTVQKVTRQGKQRQRLVNVVFGLEYIGIP